MRTFTNLFFILFLWAGLVLQLQAQTRPPVKIGNASEVKARFEAKVNKVKRGAQAQIIQKVSDQSSLVLNLKSNKKVGSTNLYYGEIDNVKNSNFFIKVEGEEVTGSIILKEQKKFYRYSSTASGSVILTEENIDEILCIGYKESVKDSPDPGNSMGSGLAAIPNDLESLPGAEAVVFLDFDGHTVSGTLWNSQLNNGEPIIADPAVMTADEIIEIWKLMSEDFRPFNLNITTNEAVFNNAAADSRMRVIFTPTNYFYPDAGGAAYVGSFTFGASSWGETPAFVWNAGIIGAGEAGSHEVGHTLNLVHDGRSAPYDEEYYSGHDSWAPIMGVGYNKPVVQWSKGEYPYANNTEDDLELITTLNGFGYRSDDHGNDLATATPLVIDADGNVSAAANRGVISTRSDVDVFSFTTDGGLIELSANPDPDYPNLDIMLSLRNADGTIIASEDSPSLSASLSENLAAGTYYLKIDGTKGALGADSDYASLGAYSIATSAYCEPVYVDGCTNFATLINNFSFNTLENNNSDCSNGNANGYTNYAPAGNLTTTVNTGQSYTLSMQSGSLNPQYFGVWIDYNNDKDFDDEGEFVYASPYNSTDQFSTTITIPVTAKLGSTRMRVRSNWDPLITNAQSCSSMTWGEAEDYTITIIGNQSPVVSITSPDDGESFTAPATINIAVDASDADGTVEKVEFFNGDTKLGEDLEAPYSYNWSNVADGTYALTARATDDSGATTTSDVISFTVKADRNQPPVVRITFPTDGFSLTIPQNPINITAMASDTDGTVAKVEFFNGTTKLGEAQKAPYMYKWRQPHTGTYSITVRATDNLGATTTSDAVQVTVTKPGKGNNKDKKGLNAASKMDSPDALVNQGLTEPVVYPNPVTANNILRVDLPGNFTESKIILHELSSGKKVSDRTYRNSQSVQLDISALSRGLYIITITTEDKIWTNKLIVLP